MYSKLYLKLLFQTYIFFQFLSFSTQNDECEVKTGNVSKEESCITTSTTTAATTTTTKYGLIELESLFIDGKPDPLLIDVPKLLFLEVCFSFICEFFHMYVVRF